MNIVIQIEYDKKDLIEKVKDYLINDLKIKSFTEKKDRSSLYNNSFEVLYDIEVWNIYVDDISEENVERIKFVFGKLLKISNRFMKIKKEKADGIKEGVNVDYHTIMEKSKFNYAEWYENLMKHKENTFLINKDLSDKLRKKREFGIAKYGDKSFQASFEASMTSPIIEHAKEELIDEINYLLHLHFVFQTQDIPLEKIEILEKNINTVVRLYEYLTSLT